MWYETFLVGGGFLLGWLVFKRPELIERAVDRLKAWWASR